LLRRWRWRLLWSSWLQQRRSGVGVTALRRLSLGVALALVLVSVWALALVWCVASVPSRFEVPWRGSASLSRLSAVWRGVALGVTALAWRWCWRGVDPRKTQLSLEVVMANYPTSATKSNSSEATMGLASLTCQLTRSRAPGRLVKHIHIHRAARPQVQLP